MGCLCCGSFHICSVVTCPITEIENNHVCTITGVVVKTITYDTSEYLTTATQETPSDNVTCRSLRQKYTTQKTPSTSTSSSAEHTAPTLAGSKRSHPIHIPTRLGKAISVIPSKKHTVSRCINFHERVCVQVLCSEITTQCYEKERIKLRNRLRWSFMRHVRAFKLRRRDMYPNCIVMLSNIATDIENYRLPITNNTQTVRKELAYSCAQDIFKFTCSMTQSNAVFTMNMDPTTMVIGLLYLLRSGLVHKNMTVLPQHRSLTYLLPPENYINMFGVKSKIITECENIVKCHLRTLSDSDIKDIGYEAFDRLV
ncbi:hypothetical protein T484DRAFT_1756651 [Baffinella frigidus]|nr:hypothetical protein T484DRAFT_1756651 [Cryptophyta sp. CCMP2293]